MNLPCPAVRRDKMRRRTRHSFRGLLETLEPRLALSTFAVNSTGDAPAVNPSQGPETASGQITLRSAIQAASAHTNDASGPDRIEFQIPGTGVQTISPLSLLPTITDPVVIDGYTQTGASPNTLAVGDNAALRINLDGRAGVNNGLTISAGNSTVRGLILTNFSGRAVALTAKGGDVVAGNFIGIVAAGDAIRDNGAGVYLGAGSHNNTIGGASVADRNIISGNVTGVLVDKEAEETLIQGNYIGTDPAGAVARRNNSGIDVRSDNTTIIGNVVSGTSNDAGITLGSIDIALVQGNLIGTDATGTHAIGNVYGIVTEAANYVTIGGTTAGERNVISGNDFTAIYLHSSGKGTQIYGNFIGTDITGTKRLTNNGDGILIDFNDPHGVNRDTFIGGLDPGKGNIIAFNGANGIEIKNSTQVASEADGEIDSNRIFSNFQKGIVVAKGTVAPPRYTITRNAIYSNNSLGIDLGDDGVTANDSKGHVGPNNYQNFPTITAVTTSDTSTKVSGKLKSLPNLLHWVEFFASAEADSSGHGEGQTYLGTAMVGTDASGNASFDNVELPALPAGQTYITATATDGDGRTSEFSQIFNTAPQPKGADLSITMSASPNPVPLGSNLTYTFTVQNLGPGPADHVIFTTAVPARSTFVSFTPPSGWTASNPGAGGTGNISAQITHLNSGATAVFTVVVRVADSMPSTDAVTAVGSVTSSSDDPDTSNNNATAAASVQQPPSGTDLAVTLSATPKSVHPDQILTYTITAKNNSATSGGDNLVTLSLPGLATYRSVVAPSGWTTQLIHDPGTDKLYATFRNLGSGASAVLTVTVIVNSSAPIGSTLTGTAKIISENPDPNEANNTASASARVVAAPSASVGVAISGNINPAKVGQVVTYTVNASNPSDVAATGVVLHVAVPANAKLVSAGGGAQVAAGVDFNVGTLAAGQSRQFKIQATALATGKITLTALAAADAGVDVGDRAVVTTSVIAVPPGDAKPLTVLNAVRYGFHAQPTIFVVTFSGDVDPHQASDPANYAALASKDGPVRTVPVSAISYNPQTHQATLRMARFIDIHHPWQLVVRGSIHSVSGQALETGGVSGRDTVIQMDFHSLLGRWSHAPGASRLGVNIVPGGPLHS